MKLRFQVRKNRHLNSNIEGEWYIVDPNGLIHQDDFYNEAHARGVCCQLNIALQAAKVEYAV